MQGMRAPHGAKYLPALDQMAQAKEPDGAPLWSANR